MVLMMSLIHKETMMKKIESLNPDATGTLSRLVNKEM
jgi:hypothetical protein